MHRSANRARGGSHRHFTLDVLISPCRSRPACICRFARVSEQVPMAVTCGCAVGAALRPPLAAIGLSACCRGYPDTMSTARVRSMLASWAAKAQTRAYSATAVAAAPRAQNVGILAMESYVANRYVAQEAMEKADGVSAGKYTIGALRNRGPHLCHFRLAWSRRVRRVCAGRARKRRRRATSVAIVYFHGVHGSPTARMAAAPRHLPTHFGPTDACRHAPPVPPRRPGPEEHGLRR